MRLIIFLVVCTTVWRNLCRLCSASSILWSGTPLLTLPRLTHAHKMCSRVASSIALATGFGNQMIATSFDDYKQRAIQLARSLDYQTVSLPVQRKDAEPGQINYLSAGSGELAKLRRALFETRDRSALFDTSRWVRNLEIGLRVAWQRFVDGTDCEELEEWKHWSDLKAKNTCSIWVEEEGQETERTNDFGAAAQRAAFMEREECIFKTGDHGGRGM